MTRTFLFKKLRENYPFQPNAERSSAKPSSDKVTNRLFELAEKYKEKREKLKRAAIENKDEDCTFKPEVNENSKYLYAKFNERPLHERYAEVLKNKKEHLKKLKQEFEDKFDHKPKISDTSKQLVNLTRNEQGPIFERLYNEKVFC